MPNESYGDFYAQFKRNRCVDWEQYYVDYEELEGLISQICHVQNRISLRDHVRNSQRASLVWIDMEQDEEEMSIGDLEDEYKQKVDDFVSLFADNDQKVSEFFKEVLHSAVKRLQGIRKYIAYYPKEEQDQDSIREAIIETYRIFLLMKNYASINFSAFHEILKTYDRRTGRKISPWFMVSQSHSTKSLHTQAKGIANYLKDIEKLYADLFHHGYRKRIKAHRDLLKRRSPEHIRNDQSFNVGFHAGFCVPVAALFTGIVVQYPRGLLDRPEVVAVWPVFRGSLCLIVLGFSWAFVTLALETRRINYMFIMKLDPKSVVRMYDIMTTGLFMLAIWLSMAYLFIAKTTGHLDLFPAVHQQLYPLAVVLSLVIFIIWPLKSKSWPTRHWLSHRLFYIILAPFTQLGFSESFVADYLTSFVKPLFDIEYTFCYYFRGDWWREDSTFCLGSNKSIALPILSALPLFWRLMQQFKRYHTTKLAWPHLANALKYMIALVLVILSSLHENWTKSASYWSPERVAWFVAMIVSTLYAYTWDICMDWGLVKWRKGRPTFRLNWTYGPEWMTIVPAILNLVGRFVWALSLNSTFNPFDTLSPQFVTLILSLIEIVRRSQWAIMRLENEHVNNYGKYRAVAEIPLAFDVDTHVITHYSDRLIRHLKRAINEGRAVGIRKQDETRQPRGSRRTSVQEVSVSREGSIEHLPEHTSSEKPTLSKRSSSTSQQRRKLISPPDDVDHLTKDEKVVVLQNALQALGIGSSDPKLNIAPANLLASSASLAGPSKQPLALSPRTPRRARTPKSIKENEDNSFAVNQSPSTVRGPYSNQTNIKAARHLEDDSMVDTLGGSSFVASAISRPISRQTSTGNSRRSSRPCSPIRRDLKNKKDLDSK
eukprot:CFRG1469T1